MTTTGDLLVNARCNVAPMQRSLKRGQKDVQTFAKNTERTLSGGVGLQGLIALGSGALPTIGRGLSSALAMRGLRRSDRAALGSYRAGLRTPGTDLGPLLERRQNTSRAFRSARGNTGALMGLVAPLLSGPGVIAAAATVATVLIAQNAMKWSQRIADATQRFSAPVIREKAMIELEDLKKDIAISKDSSAVNAQIFRMRMAQANRDAGGVGLGVAWDYGMGVKDAALAGVTEALWFNMRGGLAGWAWRALFSEGGVK